MLWCQSATAQNTGQSNHKLKSALKCTVCTPGRPRQTDEQTDEHIMAITRRFVLTNASRAKNRLHSSDASAPVLQRAFRYSGLGLFMRSNLARLADKML